MNARTKLPIHPALLGLAAACLLLPLVAHAHIGAFVRLMADDYCTAGMARNYGVLGAIHNWYMTWSGRYATYVLVSLAGIVGPRANQAAPVLTLCAWMAAGWWCIDQFLRRKGIRSPGLAAGLAALLIYSSLETVQTPGQTIYWSPGIFTLLVELVLLTIFAGMLLAAYNGAAAGKTIHWRVIAFLLTFIASGFIEVFSALQITLYVLALLALWRAGKGDTLRPTRSLLGYGLAGALLGLAVDALAPGNAYRQSMLMPAGNLLEFAWGLLASTAEYFAKVVVVRKPLDALDIAHRLITLAGVLGSSIVIGASLSSARPAAALPPAASLTRRLAWLPLFTLTAILSCFAPSALVMSGELPSRAYIIPQYILVAAMAWWGFELGQLLSIRHGENLHSRTGRLAAVIILAVTCLNAGWAAWQILQVRPEFVAYAQAWDLQDAKIQASAAAGLRQVVIQPIPEPLKVGEPGADPDHWVNRCMNRYYGLRIVVYK